MALLLEFGAGFGTTMPVAHGFVHIASHIWSAIISSHAVIHMTLSRMSGKRRQI